MNPASTWLKTFAGGFVVVTALMLVTLFTPVPYGDLSRIGRLSDAEFGWREAPPQVPQQALSGVPLDRADIVVLGDSFSMTHTWQAPLVQAGYKVSTMYWGQIGWMCQDFTPWLRKAGYKGRLVIVESVERLLDERMRESARCSTMHRAPQVKTEPFMKPLTQVPDFGLNWGAKLTTGVVTWFNTRKARRAQGDTLHGKDTQVRAVPDGCRQFTHRLCQKALFFKEDIDNGPLTAQTLQRMQALDAAQSSLDLLWMVIPNKTTVYLDPPHSRAFEEAFRATGLGPDLFAFAQRERTQVPDFYFPNDTHISMHGQLALGRLMLSEVQKRQPPARSRTP